MDYTAKSSDTIPCFQVPIFILDDLCSRFIINIPEKERSNLIRVFFQIELAHWFYLDFYCQNHQDAKPCGIKDFSAQVFRHCPGLTHYADNVDDILSQWREYKQLVPTYGAILLDRSLQFVVLVQGYWSKSSWGFPKGKINANEKASDCAVREVYEETSFNIRSLLDEEEYIEFRLNEQLTRLYLIPNVSMETEFMPRTRGEIKKVEWFRLDRLPAHKKDLVCKSEYGINPNSFFMVIPFVKSLRKWVSRRLSTSPRQSKTTESVAQQLQKDLESDAGQSQNESRIPVSPQPNLSSPHSGRKQHPAVKISASQTVQILKRTDKKVEKAKPSPGRNLASQFTKMAPVEAKRRSREPNPLKSLESPFFSKTWSDFKLNSDEFMKVFFGNS